MTQTKQEFGKRVFVGPDKKGLLSFQGDGAPPKYVVESVFSDCIKEMALTFETVWTQNSEKLTKVQQFQSALSIWVAEMDQVVFLTQHLKPSTLTPKHKVMQKLVPMLLIRTELLREAVKDVTEETDVNVVGAAKEAVSILTLFHNCLNENTSQKDRKALAKEFEDIYFSHSEEA